MAAHSKSRPPHNPTEISNTLSMKLTTRKWFFTLASIGALSASPALAVNIAGNGGFEVAGVGGPTDSDMWTETAGGAAGTQSVRGGPAATGLFSHEILAFGATGLGGSAVVTQNSTTDVGLPSLLAGSTLSASFDYAAGLGPGGVAFAELKILGSTGGIVATSGLIPLGPTGGAGFFVPSTIPALTVPAFGPFPNDTYSSFIEFSSAAGAFTGSFANVWIDNVVINATLIPEPTSAALFALGFLGILRRRRA